MQAVAVQPPGQPGDELANEFNTQDETAAPEGLPDSQPLPQVPETTVIAQPEGIGSQGLAVPSSTEVTTATRTETPYGNVASSLSVITAEQIQASRHTDVSELLRSLPGVDVVRQGQPGSGTSVFLRGANAFHTKVLIDGIPANDPIDPNRAFNFSQLAVDNIERIEVLRGPQSTLYGSDALGGVINIVTAKGQGPSTLRTDLFGGYFNTVRESFRASGGGTNAHYSIGGSYFESDGFSAANSRRLGNAEDDGFRLGTMSARTGWTPADNFDVDFAFRMNRGTIYGDDGGGDFRDDPNEETFIRQTFGRVQVRYATIDDIWEQRLILGVADHDRDFDDPIDPLHPFAFGIGRFNGLTETVEWQHSILLHETNNLVVGVVDMAETGDSTFDAGFGINEFAEQRLRDTAVYVEDQINVGDRWIATLGARQDNYSQAGVADTYRVTNLVRLPITETAFRGTIGTAFRAPSLFQLFAGPFAGNPDLLPEESKGWDVGLEQPMFDGNLVIGCTYFRNDFENLIDFDAFFIPQNIAEAQATGVELNGLVILTELTTLTASYTATDAIDSTTGLQLLRRPRDKAGLGINRRCFNDRGNVNLSLLYIGERTDAVGFPPARVRLEEFITAGAAASFDVTDWCSVYGRLDNIFNERYEEVFGFGTSPAAAYTGMSVIW